MVLHTPVIDPTTTKNKSLLLGNCVIAAFPALKDGYQILIS
jgi:hypothetical protein